MVPGVVVAELVVDRVAVVVPVVDLVVVREEELVLVRCGVRLRTRGNQIMNSERSAPMGRVVKAGGGKNHTMG